MLIKMVSFVLLVFTFSYTSSVAAGPKPGQIVKVLKQAVIVYSWYDKLFGDSGEESGTLIQKCGCWGTDYQPPSEPQCKSKYVHAITCGSGAVCLVDNYGYYGKYTSSYSPYEWKCR
jgi:hypothetical protein